MHLLNAYSELNIGTNRDEIFASFLSNLKPSSMLWSYFVNWSKVFENTRRVEISLNLMNYLIGKENFENEFELLVREHNEIIPIVPLLAVRDGKNTKKFSILVDYSNYKLTYEDFDFTQRNPIDADITSFLKFMTETGIKELIQSRRVKNLVDYMIGVEAGLDSNGRKNRGGTAMEIVVETFINDFCRRRNYSYLSQANAKKILAEWNIEIEVSNSSRKYDFVVNTGDELVFFETNFYGSEGSKLKSTVGEYRKLSLELKGKHKFVWVTDGLGWVKTHLPLRDAFADLDYIFNLEMLEKGILFHIPLNE